MLVFAGLSLLSVNERGSAEVAKAWRGPCERAGYGAAAAAARRRELEGAAATQELSAARPLPRSPSGLSAPGALLARHPEPRRQPRSPPRSVPSGAPRCRPRRAPRPASRRSRTGSPAAPRHRRPPNWLRALPAPPVAAGLLETAGPPRAAPAGWARMDLGTSARSVPEAGRPPKVQASPRYFCGQKVNWLFAVCSCCPKTRGRTDINR